MNKAMDGLFRKSLTDLVRGIRANKKDEHKFITKCLQEIKDELRSTDRKVKVVAIQKLTYVRRSARLASSGSRNQTNPNQSMNQCCAV